MWSNGADIRSPEVPSQTSVFHQATHNGAQSSARWRPALGLPYSLMTARYLPWHPTGTHTIMRMQIVRPRKMEGADIELWYGFQQTRSSLTSTWTKVIYGWLARRHIILNLKWRSPTFSWICLWCWTAQILIPLIRAFFSLLASYLSRFFSILAAFRAIRFLIKIQSRRCLQFWGRCSEILFGQLHEKSRRSTEFPTSTNRDLTTGRHLTLSKNSIQPRLQMACLR